MTIEYESDATLSLKWIIIIQQSYPNCLFIHEKTNKNQQKKLLKND